MPKVLVTVFIVILRGYKVMTIFWCLMYVVTIQSKGFFFLKVRRKCSSRCIKDLWCNNIRFCSLQTIYASVLSVTVQSWEHVRIHTWQRYIYSRTVYTIINLQQHTKIRSFKGKNKKCIFVLRQEIKGAVFGLLLMKNGHNETLYLRLFW
jgi:hypothetical protein